MLRPELSRWIALIRERSRHGYHEDALHLFQRMQRLGFPPDRYILPSVLRSCANLCHLITGKVLHSFVIRSLFDGDAFIDASLIDMYAKCGQVDHARRVFDGVAVKDVVVWNSMILSYARRGLVEHAMDLLELMQASGTRPDSFTWNALISGFSRVGCEEKALDLFSMMRLEGFDSDVHTWTSVISGLVRCFQYDKAFAMFRQMVAVAAVQPNSVTISSLLPACANVMDLRRGKEMHGYALVIGVVEDLYVSSSLIDMYAKCGVIFEAENIFDKMKERNTVSWNSMIFGYGNHGYCDHAIRLFHEMQKKGVKPDHLTFTAVLNACSNAGLIEVGRNSFDLLQKEYGIKPRLEHCACMVDLLGRAGMLVEAHDFIKEMPIKPDSFVWGALLGACRKHGDVKLAKIAASCLSRLEPKSPGSNLVMKNALVDAGRWGDASKIKELIKKRKFKRYLGCSWLQAA